MLWVGLSFLSGEIVALALPEVPGGGWIIAALGAWLMLLWQRRKYAAWMILGLVWTLAYVKWHWHPLDPALEGRDLILTGRIEDIPVRRALGMRFDFLVDSPASQGLPKRLRLSWYGAPELKAGERWQLKVRLKRPHGFANPGSSDYERTLFSHGIGALGYVRAGGKNLRLAEAWGLARWRQELADLLEIQLSGSPYRGIVKALGVGVQEGISEEQWEVLRRTGTAHLVAISGLHIGMVAGLWFWIGRKAWLWLGHWRLGADQVGAVLGLAFAGGYAALAGFSVPTQRALVMLGAGLLALFSRRPVSPAQAFGAALLFVLVLDPLAPLTVSFWLSFGAVAWILYAVAGRLRAPKWALFRVQGYLLAGLAPFLVGFFHQISLSAPLANMIAVPVVTFGVVPWVLASCALLPIVPEKAELVLAVPLKVLDWLWSVLDWLADLHDGLWPLPSPDGVISLLLASLGIGWLLAPRGLAGRWLGAVLLLPILWPQVERPNAGELWVTVLDVGQGLAAVAETQNHVLVYDTGPLFGESFTAGDDIIAPFLQQSGRKRLDLILLSHGDLDHSGGLMGLLRRFPAPILTSAWQKLVRVGALPCQAGQSWEWDGVRFSVLWPESLAPSAKANDHSCVLKVETAWGSALFPGDVEKSGEAALVKRYGEALKAEVLLVPHHGSNTSSSFEFLRQVAPEYGLISSGYRNRFGFPARQVLERYFRFKVQVFNTAQDGAVQIRLGAHKRVTAWRRRHLRIWSWRPSAESALP